MEKNSVFLNRRKFDRIRSQLPVSVKSGKFESAVTTLDLSEGGLAYRSSHMLPVGSEVDLDVRVPTTKEPVRFKGKVKRLCELTDNDGYMHGIEFGDDDRSLRTLRAYLELIDVKHILQKAVDSLASDVHLQSGRRPYVRVQGELVELSDEDVLDPKVLEQLVFGMLSQKQEEHLLRTRDIDFSFPKLDTFHCRANAHYEMGNIALSLRLIPMKIRSCDELKLPRVFKEVARRRKGLIIVGGPSGSGKSTTMAAILDEINATSAVKIITIEDPVEYVHPQKKALIAQREVGTDTLNFADALKYALRQDPDVIMVGEIRDRESISMAITAAETGHLVLTTLHTPDTIEAINRMLDVYPGDQQDQIRSQLSECLSAVIGQHLLPKANSDERILATEVMIPTDAIRNMIRTGATNAIRLSVEMGLKYGMHTMDQDLIRMVREGLLKEEVARAYARHPQAFEL